MINAAVVIPDPVPPAPNPTLLRDALTVHDFKAPEARIDPAIALIHVRVLIDTFAEVDGYDRKRHHNQPAPQMWRDDKEYLGDLRSLLHELRRLNDQLERLAKTQTQQPPAATVKTVGLVSKAATKFVEDYAGTSGKIAAGLTFVAMGSLLHYLGVASGIVEVIFEKIKPLK